MNPEPLNPSSVAVVVNDNPTQLSVLSGLVRKAGLEPRAFTGAEAALAAMDREHPPDLIVTDIYMQGIDGWRFCRLLRSPDYAAFNRVPIVVVSATFAGDEIHRIAADLGAEAFFPSPVDGKRFVEQVRAILSGRRVRTPVRVLIVEDSTTLACLLSGVFAAYGYKADMALTARAAADAFEKTAYDLALLDYHLPDGPGDALLDLFRAQRPDCVCLMMTGDPGPELALNWMKRGAAAYLKKPFQPEYVIELCAKARRERALLRVQDLLEMRTRELRESQEKHRILLEESPDPIFSFTPEGQYKYVNRAFAEGVGKPVEEIVGRSIWDVFPKEEADRRFAFLSQVFRTGEGKVIEVRVPRADGDRCYVTTITPIKDPAGAVVSAICSSKDISERKRAENALRESEEKAQQLARESTLMAEIGRIISSTLDINEVYEPFSEVVRNLVPFDRIVINTVDPEKKTVTNVYMAGKEVGDRTVGKIYPLEGAGNAEMVRTQASFLFQPEDVDECGGRYPMLRSTFQAGFRSVLDVPLFSKGRIIGGLLLRSLEPHAYTEQDVRVAERIADQIAGAIENARLFAEHNRLEEALRINEAEALRLARENAALARIGKVISSSLEIEDVFEAFSEEVRQILPLDRLAICLTGDKEFTRIELYSAPNASQCVEHAEKVPNEGTLTEYIARTRQGVVLNLEDRDEVVRRFPKLVRSFDAGLRTFLSVPLLSRDRVVGVLHIQSFHPGIYNERHFLIAESIGSEIAGAIDNARLFGEHRRLSGVLREQQEKYRELFDGAPVGYHELDGEGRIVQVNRTELEMLGYPEEEMVGRFAWEFVVEREECRQDHGEKIAGTKPAGLDFERTILRKDGTSFPVVMNDRPLRDREGRITGMRSTVQDITERRQAEEALREREERLRLFIEHAPASLAMFDRQMCYLSASRRWSRDYSLGERNLTGLSHYDVFPEIPEHLKAVHRRGLSGEVVRAEDDRFVRADGSVQWLRWEVRPWHDQTGGVAGIVIFSEDITERRRTEEEKAKLENELQQAQKMESVGRLAGGVAHDFNNKLGVIIGYSEMALEEVESTSLLHQHLTDILDAARRSATLTRQLLAFARKQTVAPKVLDLNDTVGKMLTMLKRLIGEGIDLAWRPEAHLWPVKVDPSRIDQILANLFVNARDAIAGVGKVTIETGNVSLDEAFCADHAGCVPGDYVLLGVSDDGCGMDKEILKYIFEPFFTTKGVGEGTGLGLATVYGAVKQNKGFINAYSKPGQGTTFTIYLPRHAGKDGQAGTEGPLGPALHGSETILLVEDEPSVLTLATKILERQGYTVVAASTPGEAIRRAKEYAGEVHLLMTDVVMPEMNGRDLAKSLLSLYPHLKRLFMSGYTADVIAHHGVLDEGVNFIQKPFLRQELAAKVREVLDGGLGNQNSGMQPAGQGS